MNNQIIPEKLLLWHEGWVEFWKKFGVIIDLADYPILPHIKLLPNQDYWSIITPPEFTPIKAYKIREGISQTYPIISPSNIIDVFPRVPVCFVKSNQNAAVEHPSTSCERSIDMGLSGTTFTEGTILDARVFVDLHFPLDPHGGWTLHTGSRVGDKSVPCSRWGAPFNVYQWMISSYSVSDSWPFFSLRSKLF